MASDGFIRILLLALYVLLASGCATRERYTSLDLDLLPCEAGDSPRFFHSIEFTAEGGQRYPAQMESIRRALQGGQVTDLVVFVHGWNKNPASAESDYQDFLCRLHGKIRAEMGDRSRANGLLMIGVFWPSTITNRPKDPMLVKPVSYYRIRNRADQVARAGVSGLFNEIGELSRSHQVRMQLIGHSFGGRIVVRALETLSKEGGLREFLQTARSVNVVLLNAAVAPNAFLWIPEAIAEARATGAEPRFTDQTRSHLFNIHSFNDSATRRLFPIASIFNDEPSTCAAGACGVPGFATVVLDDAGNPIIRDGLGRCDGERINAWNVDATKVVFDHTDIYKGRIASLLARLTYDEGLQRSLPGMGADGFPCAAAANPDPARPTGNTPGRAALRPRRA